MLGMLSILLAWLLGFLLVQVLDPVRNMQPRWAAVVFDAALGAGIGMGLTSTIFLLMDVSGVATPAAIFGSDIILVAVLAWQWFRMRPSDQVDSASRDTIAGFRWTWLLAAAFGIVLVITWIRVVQIAIALPLGEWDAWTLWNLRAKFLAGPGGSWRYAVSPLLYGTHPDYPLLLSAFVARVWRAGGSVYQAGGAVALLAPVVTALGFFAALLALLMSAVALLRGTASALLAGLVILSTTSLLIWAPSQYADIPLAFFYLGAIALILLAPSATPGGARILPWAGMCAGLAAWTKNEGVVFLICITVVFFAFTLWRLGTKIALIRTGLLFAGAAPGVLLTLWLKFFLAPATDPLVTQGISGLGRLHDVSRYVEVASGFLHHLLNLGSGLAHPLILLAILAIVLRWQVEKRDQLAVLIASTAVVLVLFSYCGVLVITPWGLEWQLQSSLDRLILQVWPSFLLVSFFLLRSVVDVGPFSAPIKTAASRKSSSVSRKRALAVKQAR